MPANLPQNYSCFSSILTETCVVIGGVAQIFIQDLVPFVLKGILLLLKHVDQGLSPTNKH